MSQQGTNFFLVLSPVKDRPCNLIDRSPVISPSPPPPPHLHEHTTNKPTQPSPQRRSQRWVQGNYTEPTQENEDTLPYDERPPLLLSPETPLRVSEVGGRVSPTPVWGYVRTYVRVCGGGLVRTCVLPVPHCAGRTGRPTRRTYARRPLPERIYPLTPAITTSQPPPPSNLSSAGGTTSLDSLKWKARLIVVGTASQWIKFPTA